MVDGRNGATNGTKISTQMVTASSKERPGGKVSMESAGTELGVSNTMVPDGFTSTERAVVVNIGTHTKHKILGMRDSLILVSFTALKTRFSLGKLKNHLRGKSLNLSKP
jgi:hypothetical protein